MYRKTTIFALLVAVLACCVCLPVFAQAFRGRHDRPPFFQPRPIFMLLRDIALTAEQEAAVQQAKDAMHASLDPLAEQLQGLEVYTTLLAPEINEAAVQETIAKQVELQCQIAQIVATANLQAAQLLTPAQRALVLENLEKRTAARESDNSSHDIMRRRPNK
jgi:Spy/CpxP family protein refolding chaperone